MIWVIGGTKDSRDFIESFPYKKKLIVTVATEYGAKLLADIGNIDLKIGKMDKKEMDVFIQSKKIEKIVDISHPYAEEVSKNAMEISRKNNIVYFRYERENLDERIGKEYDNLDSLLEAIEKIEGNILSTLGSNSLERICGLKNKENIYFRILPKWDIIKKSEELGVLAKNIIAMQGPFTLDMNLAIIKQFDIKCIVSKKSGNIGGEREKIDRKSVV